MSLYKLYQVEIAAYTLYIAILVHAFYALVLTVKNRKARPVKYAVAPKTPVRWASLNMGLLGSIIFLFLVVHRSNRLLYKPPASGFSPSLFHSPLLPCPLCFT